MNVLEKILEEIEAAAVQEDAPFYIGDMEADRYILESVVREILCRYMNDVSDTVAGNTEIEKK